MKTLSGAELAAYIDHTLLKPDATEDAIRRCCEEALEYKFCTVCVEAKWLPLARKILDGSSVKPIAVIDFPLGQAPTQEKVRQAEAAVALGAREIDMVLNRQLLAARDHAACLEDIRQVVQRVGNAIPVKVILETSELSREEIAAACVLAKLAGASFVKTSTGFSKAGAKVEDVALMRDFVGASLGVKASGGVRDRATCLQMIAAGATRIGASASVAIVLETEGAAAPEGGY